VDRLRYCGTTATRGIGLVGDYHYCNFYDGE
jgi:hypothetical protein